MAVSFSTGGSGYMRSDFMISDAAIPIRSDEAAQQAEQTERFSQVLSGIGGKQQTTGSAAARSAAEDIPAEDTAVSVVERFTEPDGKVDCKKLAKAVADGEVKLSDIPDELITGEFLKELALLAKTRPADDSEDTEEKPVKEQQANSDINAMLAVQQTAVVPDDKTAEITQLAQAANRPAVVEEVQQVTEVPQQLDIEQPAEKVQPVVQENIPVQQAAEIPAEDAVQTAVQFAAPVQEEQSVQTEQEVPIQQSVPVTDKEVSQLGMEQAQQVVQAPEAQQETQSGQDNAPQYSDSSEQPQVSAQPAKAEQSQAASERRDFAQEITSVRTRTAENAPKAEQPAEEQPVFAEDTMQRSRVVSKSDELEMIKGSADTAKTDESAAALAQPQTAQSDRPVVFQRTDGTEVAVRPAEVAKQVADKLTERIADLKEGAAEYTVTLDPEDLGRITVKMIKTADGAVSVSIAAENSKTLRIIEQNGANIQESLKNNGVQLEDWQTVGESRQEAHAEDYQGSSKNPYRESDGQNKSNDEDDKSFAELIASM